LSGAFKAVTRTHVYPQCVAKELSNYQPSAPCFSRFFSSGKGEGKKVLGVFYKAHEYADNPEFLGCAENALGIREWLESQGHTYVVTSDKEGPDSELDRELPDTNILITTPFHPVLCEFEGLAYLRVFIFYSFIKSNSLGLWKLMRTAWLLHHYHYN
jgi:hypothetical protein